MSSVRSACRLSARLAARSAVRRKASSREFSKSAAPCAAQNFTLPSLSPTMTEGGISSWKVKEGDSFSAGDVLLEIETDKAQMDVEAQDDGKVWKILQQDGAKGLKVGTRIAVFAEAEDDLESLEMPPDEGPSAEPAKKEAAPAAEEKPKEKEEEKKAEPTPSPPKEEQKSSPSPSESSHGKGPSRSYPPYPSVQYLLHTNGLSDSDASKIPATGPNGRLLKGDVLSYLGKIEKSYAAESSKRITKLSHLDLSNIKIAVPKKDAAAAKGKEAAAAAKAEPEPDTQIAVPISLAAVFATQRRLQDTLGITLPLSTFIARASDIANQDLPRAKAAPTADELFDAVLGLDKIHPRRRTSTGSYIPQITALGLSAAPSPAEQRTALMGSSAASRKAVDIIDEIAGLAKKPARSAPSPRGPSPIGAEGAENVFSLTVKKGEEKRARVYLERVKTVLELEPGSCVL